MLNKPILILWTLSKIDSIEKKIKMDYFENVEDKYRAEGELKVLKELYEDFNFDSVEEMKVKYHNDF